MDDNTAFREVDTNSASYATMLQTLQEDIAHLCGENTIRYAALMAANNLTIIKTPEDVTAVKVLTQSQAQNKFYTEHVGRAIAEGIDKALVDPRRAALEAMIADRIVTNLPTQDKAIDIRGMAREIATAVSHSSMADTIPLTEERLLGMLRVQSNLTKQDFLDMGLSERDFQIFAANGWNLLSTMFNNANGAVRKAIIDRLNQYPK